MKKTWITLMTLGLSLGIAEAQMGPGGPPPGGPPSPPEVVPPNADIPPEILDLQAELRALREELRVSRREALDGLGEGATREQKMVAVADWHAENEGRIMEMQEVSEELRDLIEVHHPDLPWEPVPDEVVGMREDLKELRRSLAESRREALTALGEDPTDEEVRAAIETWRTDNAGGLEEASFLAEELRQWFRENRPDRRPPSMAPGLAQRRQAFRENARQLRQEHRELRELLQDPSLTEEERRMIIEDFRAEQRELVQERRTLKRQERIDQGGVGGDRRPGG